MPKKKTDPTYHLSPYEKVVANLAHEERILQKNLKILLNQCDFVETWSTGIKNRNNITEILRVID